MQHFFIAYVPESNEEEEKEEAKELDEVRNFGAAARAPGFEEEKKGLDDLRLSDLELGFENSHEFSANEVCFICQYPRDAHDMNK